MGYLPRTVADGVVAESQRLRSTYAGIVLRDYRHAASQERTAIKLLLGPDSVVATRPG